MTRNVSTRHRVLGVLLGATLALGALAIVAGATPCYDKASPCKVQVTTAIYNGGPPYPVCLNGAALYSVIIAGRCKDTGNFGPASQVVCSVISQPVSINIGGRTHTISLTKGTWKDVHNGNCKGVEYSVS